MNLILLYLCLLTAMHEPSDASIRVMTFNIRYGTANDGENHWNKRKEFLRDTVKQASPDLLGTQETLAFQRDYLANEFPQYEAFGVGRDDGQNKGEMAALFFNKTRFERLAGGHFWLSPTPEKIASRGWDAALPRIASWVKLKDRQSAGGMPVLFLNTHFDHRGQVARKKSAELIREKIQILGEGCTIIVTGDFNAGEGSEPYQALFSEQNGKRSIIVDAYRSFHTRRAAEEGTFNGFKPDARKGDRIDWIACTRDWQVKQAKIDHSMRDGKVPSDHFPVLVTLFPATR